MRKNGFTLIELLVVIAIIGVISSLGVVSLNSAREKARTAKAQSDLQGIFNALALLANDTGQWPGHQEVDAISAAANNEICGEDVNSNTCAASLSDASSGLVSDDGASPYSNWAGPYMPTLISDPWGREYFFDTDYSVDFENNPCECTNTGCHDAVVVGSYGPDGAGVPSGGTDGSYGCDDIIRIIFQ